MTLSYVSHMGKLDADYFFYNFYNGILDEMTLEADGGVLGPGTLGPGIHMYL